jgi:hypothetical protein
MSWWLPSDQYQEICSSVAVRSHPPLPVRDDSQHHYTHELVAAFRPVPGDLLLCGGTLPSAAPSAYRGDSGGRAAHAAVSARLLSDCSPY